MQNHTTRDSTNEIKYCACGCGKPVKPKRKYVRGHGPKGVQGLTLEQRLWNKVDKRLPIECWPFLGARRNGYGVLNDKGKVIYAHRLSFELAHGPIPEDLCIMHSCDRRACCNPAHLFSGTKGDNNRDAYEKGRGRGGGKKGEPHTKLTEEDVREIRNLSEQGIRYPALAEQFGISIPAISMIVTRKRWPHVE